MSKPTREQLTQFWRWCGFEDKWEDTRRLYLVQWQYPDGQKRAKLPAVSLNSLFKWAVPKVRALHGIDMCTASVTDDGWYVVLGRNVWGDIAPRAEVEDEDLVSALFWAIWQVIE